MNINKNENDFSEDLKNYNLITWEKALNHRFFREISDDKIEDDIFKNYLAIEYSFVDTSAKFLGYAIAKAPGFEERKYLSSGLYGLTTEQRDFFINVFEKLQITPGKQIPSLRAKEQSKGLHEHFLHIAKNDGYEEILACTLAAEWLYFTWCTHASSNPSKRWYIRDWVSLHVENNFSEHVNWIRNELNKLTWDLSSEKIKRISEIFKTSLVKEIEFHNAAFIL